jgi:gas vesicle structural protein
MAAIQKMTESSSLADVLNIILDKGIVIDAWASVSLVGIQLLTIEARVVIASVDTYLRYAQAIGEIESPPATRPVLPKQAASSVIPPVMTGTAAPVPAPAL